VKRVSASSEFVTAEIPREKRRNAVADFFIRLIREKPSGVVGLVLVLLLFFCGIFANFLAPYGMNETHLIDRLAPPSTTYLLGTDNLGRDLLSRIIYGARVSMIVGLGASSITAVIATLLGLLSGYLGGKFDITVQRFVDTWVCFPWLVIYLTIMSLIGAGLLQVVLVLGVGGGISGSRLIRSAALSLKGNVYVEATKAIGSPTWSVIFKHLLPNVLPLIIINFTLSMANYILIEASLSFLGWGVPPPNPSWGGMLSGSGRTYMYKAPGMAFFPGLALTLAVYGINMFGDSLRDLLDPRLRGGVGGMGGYGAQQAAKAKRKMEVRAKNA
jgi:peptide/nickel transport system permease protein